MNDNRYFKEIRRSIYFCKPSREVMRIAKERKGGWEDRIFLELFRDQRKYLKKLWEIDPWSEIASYVSTLESNESIVSYVNQIIEKITKRTESVASRYQKAWDFYCEARGKGKPGSGRKLEEAINYFFDDYIYHLEMRYDVAFLALPKSGESVRTWLLNSIDYLMKEMYEDILDRVDYAVNSFVEGTEIDLSKMFTFTYSLNIDANPIIPTLAVMGLNNVIEKEKIVHCLNLPEIKPCDIVTVIMPFSFNCDENASYYSRYQEYCKIGQEIESEIVRSVEGVLSYMRRTIKEIFIEDWIGDNEKSIIETDDFTECIDKRDIERVISKAKSIIFIYPIGEENISREQKEYLKGVFSKVKPKPTFLIGVAGKSIDWTESSVYSFRIGPVIENVIVTPFNFRYCIDYVMEGVSEFAAKLDTYSKYAYFSLDQSEWEVRQQLWSNQKKYYYNYKKDKNFITRLKP